MCGGDIEVIIRAWGTRVMANKEFIKKCQTKSEKCVV